MGMFDDLEKQVSAEETKARAIPAKKKGLFDDMQGTAPGGKLFKDLETTKLEEVPSVEVPQVEAAKEDADIKEGNDFFSKAIDYKPTGNWVKDFAQLAYKMLLHGGVGPMRDPLGKAGELGATTRKALSVDQPSKAEEYWRSKRVSIPGKPDTSKLLSAPAILGEGLAATPRMLAKWTIPENAEQVALMFALPDGAQMLDEYMSIGTRAITQSAPNATAQILRSMLEIADPVAKQATLKKIAPLIMGRPMAKGMDLLPASRLGPHELDPIVSDILGKLPAPKQASTLFRKGLDSYTPADLEVLGGRKLVTQVKKYLTKTKGSPEELTELITNFTPSQQRSILRRGLGNLKLIGETSGGRDIPPFADLGNPGKIEQTISAADTTKDHLTGMALVDSHDGHIEKAFSYKDFKLGEGHHHLMPGFMPEYDEMMANETHHMVVMTEGKFWVWLAQQGEAYHEKPVLVKKILEQMKPSKTTAEVDLFGGEKFLNASLSKLNAPVELSPDQKDLLASMALRENLDAMKGQPKLELPNLDKVEQALNNRRPRSTTLQKMSESAKDLTNKTVEFFEFEHRLKAYPQFRYALEQAQGYPHQAARESTAVVESVLEILNDKKDYETFRKAVILQDWKEALEGGQEKITNNISLEQVNQALAGLDFNERVVEAMERHHTVVQALGEDLVRRGYLTPEQLKSQYFRHDVIKQLEESFGDEGTNPKVKIPFRSYTLPRTETAAAIDTDYMGVMHRLLVKVKMDNFMDDTVVQEANRLDVLRTLPDEVRTQLFGEKGSPMTGKTYKLGDKYYKAFRYFPRRMGMHQDTQLMEDAINAARSPEELDQLLGPAQKLAGVAETHLVPAETYDALVRFTHPIRQGRYFDLIKNPVRLWKRLTLMTAGVPWQMGVFSNNLLHIMREGDFAAIANLPKAVKLMAKADESIPIYREALNAGLVRPQAPLWPTDSPELFRFLDDGDKFRQAVMTPLKWYDNISNVSMNGDKLMKYMADVARIQRGQPVQTKSFKEDIAGLLPLQQAVKVAKLTVVEMAVNNPKFNTLFRDLMFPFISAHYHGLKGWAKYAYKNPGDATAFFLGPYAATQLWNWRQYPEIERSLPEHRKLAPHVITGWLDHDGNHIVVSMATMAQKSAKLVAGDALLSRASQVIAGELDLKEAIKGQVEDMAKAPFHFARALINPAVNALYGIATNTRKSEEGGGKIIPERLRGTSHGLRLQQAYLLNNLVTPVSTWMRSSYKEEAEPAHPLARFLRYGPLDYTRMVVQSYPADLKKMERSMRYQRHEEGTVIMNEHMDQVVEAWVKANVTGDFSGYDKVLEKQLPKIQLPSGKSIGSELKSPRIQVRILKEKLALSKDPAQRKQLIADIHEWEEISSLADVKTTAKPIRGYALEGEQP